MNSKFVGLLKKIYYCLRDDNNEQREFPINFMGTANTSIGGVRRLNTLLDVVFNSDSIYEGTKLFIMDNEATIKDINDLLAKRDIDKKIKNKEAIRYESYSTVLKKVHADNKKLMDTFGLDIVHDCIYNRIDCFEEFDRRINLFIAEYGASDKLRYNLTLDIDTKPCQCNTYKGNEEFFEILESLEPYIKARMKIVEDVINNNTQFIEYFNYLLNLAVVKDDDIVNKDRERLLKFLRNEDYMDNSHEYEEESSEEEIDSFEELESFEELDSFEEESDETNDNNDSMNNSDDISFEELIGLTEFEEVKDRGSVSSDSIPEIIKTLNNKEVQKSSKTFRNSPFK